MQRSNGFTLIELLIVILIIGVVTNLAVYSVKLIDRPGENSFTKLKKQKKIVQHKAQMSNFLMRIRLAEDSKDNTQSIIAEYFDVEKQIWSPDTKIEAGKITLNNQETVLMDYPFIVIHPNSFVANGQICINDECLQYAKKQYESQQYEEK